MLHVLNYVKEFKHTVKRKRYLHVDPDKTAITVSYGAAQFAKPRVCEKIKHHTITYLYPGPSCAKLNESISSHDLKFLSWYGICWKKKMSSFLNCKSYSHFCSINIDAFEKKKKKKKKKKNNLATTVNEFVIKLTMLWTTGPWS